MNEKDFKELERIVRKIHRLLHMPKVSCRTGRLRQLSTDAVLLFAANNGCSLCKHGEEACRIESSTGQKCCREKGHTGQHVACTLDAHGIERWGKEW